MSNHYKVIGKNIKKYDAIDKVTGTGQFVADIKLPNVLSTAILRSRYAHATIQNIDWKEVNTDGIYAIVSGKGALCIKNGKKQYIENSKKYWIGDCIVDQHPMAIEKVRYVGEPVVAVIGNSDIVVQEAIKKIKIDYLPLPFVLNPKEAIANEAPLIHEKVQDYKRFKTYKPDPDSNVFHHYTLLKGDAKNALQNAEVVFEHEFSYPHISHAQLEPHGCICGWERNGEITIYTSSQSPFFVRNIISEAFHISHHMVKVIVPYIGGGFGGKSDVTIEPLVAYISRFVPGYFVRYILTREEMFTGSLLGRGCFAKVKTGLTKEGKIQALKVKLLFQAGAYGNCTINIVTAAGHNSSGPYEIENIQSESLGVYTNTPYVGAFRGYGHPEVHWMMDRNLEIIARKMDMDSFELKKKNLLRPGCKNALQQVITEEEGRLEDCVDFVYQEVKNYKHQEDGFLYGYGFSPIMKSPVVCNNAASCIHMKFNEDTSVSITMGAIDMGQGACTALAQIAAEALQMPIEKMRISRTVATEYSPYEWQTVASRATWTLGRAIIRAANRAIQKFKEMASKILNIDINDLKYDGEKVFSKSKYVDLRQMVMGHLDTKGRLTGGPISVHAHYIPPNLTFPDEKTGQGNLASEWTFGCQGIVISVDSYSGEIYVKKMVTAMDVGKVIHPEMARAQVVGAMVQALGAAMTETILYDKEGHIQNHSFTDYKIPTPEDLMDTEFVVKFFETPFSEGPFGAKCLAEHGTVGIAPALANAVHNATGIDFYDLPITSEKLLLKMTEGKK